MLVTKQEFEPILLYSYQQATALFNIKIIFFLGGSGTMADSLYDEANELLLNDQFENSLKVFVQLHS